MIYPLQRNLETPDKRGGLAVYSAYSPSRFLSSATATQPLSLDYTHRRFAWRLLKLADVIRTYVCDTPCAAEQV